MGVVKKLPVAAVLCRDLPILMDLLLANQPAETDCGKMGEGDKKCLVDTRAQAKSGVELLPNLDSGLCQGDTQEPIKMILLLCRFQTMTAVSLTAATK